MNTDDDVLRSVIGLQPDVATILRVFGGCDGMRNAIIETLAGFEIMRRDGVQIDETGLQMWAMARFALLALDWMPPGVTS